MAIRKLSASSAFNITKSNKFWDGSTERGSIVPIGTVEANGLSSVMNFNNISSNKRCFSFNRFTIYLYSRTI
jgi:hypothetical protein